MIVLIAAFGVSSGILYGYNLGVISGAILEVNDQFALTATLREMTISSSLFGAMLGALLGGKLATWFGRQRVIIWATMLGGGIALVGALAPSIWVLIGYRLTAGLSFGMLACVTPLYLAEISPSNRRGRLVALFSVALVIGLLFAYLADLIFENVAHGWRWMFWAGILPALPLLVIALNLPESPRWLSQNGDKAGMRRSLDRLEELREEIDETALNQASSGQQAQLQTLLHPRYRTVLVTALGLAFIRQGTGVAISTFYAPELLRMAGFSSVTVDLLGTVGVGVIYVVMTLVALWLVDHLGRRPLMHSGLLGMAAGSGILGIALLMPAGAPLAGAIGVGGLFLFAAAFAIGPGAVVFVLMSEILPQHIRALGMGVASLTLWLTYFVSTYTFPILDAYLGKSNVFFMYSGICVLSAMFVYFMVPETKGRRLETIE